MIPKNSILFSGADEKIRRRIYKRSSPVTNQEEEPVAKLPAPIKFHCGGSTGSQSDSHDSNNDSSEPDRAADWFKPMSHPIPVPGGHSGGLNAKI